MKLKMLMYLLVCCAVLGAAATAKEMPTVTRLDPTDIQMLGPGTRTDGQVGNLNEPYYQAPDYITGQEEYKYLFNPGEQINCPVGFQLTFVHMLVQFGPHLTFPVDFSMSVNLEAAQWDEALDCWTPGVEECVSDVFDLSVAQSGLYDISLPIDCACAYQVDPTGAPFWYLLSVHFPTAFVADLIIDNIPLACHSWNNWGDGWFDLVVDLGFPGGIIMYGDVDCCTEPVDLEERSWGGIKSLFR